MRIHFIAIGGSIMHDLAIALHRQGHEVSGSDDAFFDPSRSRLEAHGLLSDKEGWDPNRIDESLDRVILGMHAKEENPELLRARELGVPTLSFPEFIAEVSREKERIVIAGSHGKTSITAMVLHVMKRQGLDTDRLIGAQLEGYDGAVRLNDDAERIIIEGDEYLSSPIDPRPKLLWYRPRIALISGIAWDHVNVFPSFEEYLDAFRSFIRSIQAGGILIYCAEDQRLRELVQEEGDGLELIPYRTLSYREEEGGCTLRSKHGTFPLKVFGEHNVQNIAGAMEVCRSLGISEKEFLETIRDFEGASLRLDTLYENGQNIAFRDYAHAPSKVRATVDAVKGRFPKRSLIAVLELHTYSSLDPAFIDEYRDSMEGADRTLILFDPEAAKRKGLVPLDPERVRTAFGDPSLSVHTDMEELEADLLDTSGLGEKEGQVLLFMSSGPFQKVDLASMSTRVLAPSQE